jgi:hypothetical protein
MMNRYVKCIAGLGALILSVALASEARAVLVADASMSLGDWATLGSFQQQDKIWTFGSSSLSPSTLIEFKTFNISPGVDQHTLTLTLDSLIGPSVNTLNYTIAVDTGMAPGFFFTQAGLDTISINPTNTSTKLITGGSSPLNLLVINGTPDTQPVFGQPTSLTVNESWTLDATGSINTSTNTFVQGSVPEPASVAVWTMLAGVGIVVGTLRARKLKQAKVAA